MQIKKIYILIRVSVVMKAYGGLEVKLHTLLILMLDGGEWPVSCSDHFIPGTY
jgi:hypothetical protein